MIRLIALALVTIVGFSGNSDAQQVTLMVKDRPGIPILEALPASAD
jgi:hypothetical protein